MTGLHDPALPPDPWAKPPATVQVRHAAGRVLVLLWAFGVSGMLMGYADPGLDHVLSFAWLLVVAITFLAAD